MAKLRTTQSGIRLNQTRIAKNGFPDLLVYSRFVAPGVLINKNETMTACAFFRGPYFQSSTEYERDSLAQAVNNAVNMLNDSWLVNIDTFRVPAAGYRDSVFPDATSAIFDLCPVIRA